MIGEIVAVFVVLAIFAVVALLLGLYVWRVDPQRFAMQMEALRARRERRDGSTP